MESGIYFLFPLEVDFFAAFLGAAFLATFLGAAFFTVFPARFFGGDFFFASFFLMAFLTTLYSFTTVWATASLASDRWEPMLLIISPAFSMMLLFSCGTGVGLGDFFSIFKFTGFKDNSQKKSFSSNFLRRYFSLIP